MYQNPTTGGAFIVYFTEQSEMQDICKLSEESDAEKEKCQSGKRYFSSLSLGFPCDLIFRNQKSKVESLSGDNNSSWKLGQ